MNASMHSAEVEKLTGELRRLAGRRVTDERLLQCVTLRSLPQVQSIEQLNLGREHLIETMREELAVALNEIEGRYEIPSLKLTADGTQITQAIRVLFGIDGRYIDESHVARREEAARLIGAVPDAQMWRRSGPGPETDLMRILARAIYSINYKSPSKFYVEHLDVTSFHDEQGRLYRKDFILQIKSLVDGLDTLTTTVSYPDDARPGVCHYEPLTGCSVESRREASDGHLNVRVRLNERVPIHNSYTVTWRETYDSDALVRRQVWANQVHAYDPFGRVVLRLRFHQDKPPSAISWYAEPRFYDKPLRPHSNRSLKPSGPMTYSKDFGLTRRGWFYGIVWTW